MDWVGAARSWHAAMRFAAVAAALAVLAVACSSTSPPVTPDDAFATFEQAIAGEGLQVCGEPASPEGIANQAIESRVYVLGVDCTRAQGPEVVVDRYASAADRDAAADQFEISSRLRGSGAVWTLDDVTIFAHGQTDDEIMRRLIAAMDAAGAQ